MKLFSILIVVLLSTVQINAQTDSIKNRINTLSEVVISGNKFSEKKKNIAQKIDIISSAEMKKMNAQTTADVLVNTGKVFVQKSQQGGGSPVIRGFEASRILLMVDGIRLNNAIYRTGHLQNIVTIDNNILERIEVLNGPASTIHGSDALGGVVSMQTKNPVLNTSASSALTGLNAALRYSTINNEKMIHADASIANNMFGALTSITYSQFGDLRQGKSGVDSIMNLWKKKFNVVQINGIDSAVANSNPFLQSASGYTQYDLLQKFTIMQNKNIKHGLNLQYSNSSDVPRYDRLSETTATGIPKNAVWYYGPQKRALVAYQFDATNLGSRNDINEVTANISYQAIEESRHNRGYKKPTQANRIEKIKVMAYNIAFRKKAKMHEFTLGTDAQLNVLKSTAYKNDVTTGAVSKIDTRYPDGDNNMNLFGVFAQHTWKTKNAKIVLNDGLRLNTTSLRSTLVDTTILFKLPFSDIKQRNTAMTGNLGVIYIPKESLRLVANFSSAFRSPNFDDMTKIFESVSGTRLIVPNNNLKPEYTRNIEASIQYNNYKTYIEVYGYYTRFNNAIVTDVFTYNGKDSVYYDGVNTKVYASVNKAKAFIYGTGVVASQKLSSTLQAYGNITYTYGRFNDGDTLIPLDHVAPLHGRVGLSYNKSIWSMDIYSLFNGKKTLENYNPNGEDNLQYATPQGMPSWYTLNAKASIKVHKQVLTQIGLENMLDKNYRYFASGLSAPGRNIILALRFNLK